MKDKKLSFSIDRLTLIGNFKQKDFFYNVYNYVSKLEETKLFRADNNMFEFSFNVDMFGFVQIDRITNKCRIDFNPNKISLFGKKVFNAVLMYLENIHYTRLDLAIDLFNYNISNYKIVDIGTRKSAYFYDKVGNLETLYSGSMTSSKYIRIYNKAREQKLDIDWWRFEIQLRDVYIDKYFSELLEFYKDILVFKYSTFDKYSIEENAMIEFLLRDISRLDMLSKNSKAKYKKIIRSLELSSIDFLDDIVAITSDRVVAWLNYISNFMLYPENDLILTSSECHSVGGSPQISR